MRLTLVVGLGKTGRSIARYLQRNNRPFVMADTRENPPQRADFITEFPEVPLHLATIPDALFSQVMEVITSPGVPLDHAFFAQAHAAGCPIIGDIECFAREVKAPVVAITGTNGKSTVTSLVGDMAQAAGRTVAVAGNIGDPVLDRLADGVDYDLWVLELSSFQLDLTESLTPAVATILNVTPDHLDRHHSLAAYCQAKQRVYHHALCCCYNRDDSQTYPVIEAGTINPVELGLGVSYGLDEPQAGQWGVRVDAHGATVLAHGEETILPVDKLKLQGRHNWLNALAACAAAAAVGVSRTAMVHVLCEFSGLAHRCQTVRTLNDVVWINDSKGTNVGATLSAIYGLGAGLRGKMVLIAGGQGKGADFSELSEVLRQYVRQAIVLGEDAALLIDAWRDCTDVVRVDSLQAAVACAHETALPGDVVLLSPACASLDMFRDFNHRGDVFNALVEAL